VLAPGLIFPFNWHEVTHCRKPECIRRVQLCGANEKTFDAAACKALFPDAYAVTYWAHTWGDDEQVAFHRWNLVEHLVLFGMQSGPYLVAIVDRILTW
jgi:hypothetical protein